MSLSKKFAAPLALSFGLMAGSATVEADNHTAANDNNTMSFSCNMPDLSHLTKWADKMEHLYPATVAVKTETIIKEKNKNKKSKKAQSSKKKQKPRVQPGSGSGFIADPRGYIFTNHHVIDGVDKIEIVFYDPDKPNSAGEKLTATLVESDAELDLAVLKVNAGKDLTCVNLGNSLTVRAGDVVGAVGHPFGLLFSYTQGVISYPNRDLNNFLFNSIQTDTSINPGNSGGPLYNEAGEVIGMNTFIFTTTGANVGTNFTSKVNDIRDVANHLLKHGKIKRGALGVGIEDVTQKVAHRLKVVKEGFGVLITAVRPGGPGDLAKIKVDDIILEVNGVSVNSTKELMRAIASHKPEEKVDLTILRGHRGLVLHAVLGERQAILSSMKPKIPDEFLPKPPAPNLLEPQKKIEPSEPSSP